VLIELRLGTSFHISAIDHVGILGMFVEAMIVSGSGIGHTIVGASCPSPAQISLYLPGAYGYVFSRGNLELRPGLFRPRRNHDMARCFFEEVLCGGRAASLFSSIYRSKFRGP